MNKGQKLFIIKTIAGDYVDIKKSAAFAKMAVEKAEKEGHQCIVIEVTVDEIHSK